ncbi:MAG: aspartate--tRNA ligase [Bacteroides sp.]
MYRTHRCGELRMPHVGTTVTVCGWVQRVRKMGGLLFVDLRDRWGIVQLVVSDAEAALRSEVEALGREWVVRATGVVRERSSKNATLSTGDVEIELQTLTLLNRSEVPPFTIETETDGGDELRMKYRYLDIRRPPVRDALLLRHQIAQSVRSYLNARDFVEIETPFLIKSTPEGARDFVVPSRMHAGEFYALPQSPQTFKQLLMVAGMERYYQIVRCFRDEDLRADRQPEFTQIDCEMSFVEREDILCEFESFMRTLFEEVLGVTFDGAFQRMPYSEAMSKYGSDKPDLRVGMEIHDVTALTRETGFSVFDNAPYVGGICVKDGAKYTRKQLDALTDFVKRPQVGGTGLIYARIAPEDGSIKSSADKFLTPALLAQFAQELGATRGDLMLFMAGKTTETQVALGTLRLEVARNEGLLDPKVFKPLWVVDFPLFEWDEETQRFYAMHHPFTSPHPDDVELFESNPGAMRANAYDMVINGTEVGGGSIRIFDRTIQERMFKALGFTEEAAQAQFGFLLDAFRYGAPPHGGIAFGFDRLCSLFGGADSIRDYIAFPKNNAGRDVMIASPSLIDSAQLTELHLVVKE